MSFSSEFDFFESDSFEFESFLESLFADFFSVTLLPPEFSFLTFQDKSLFRQATDSKSDTGYKQLDSNNLSMKSQVLIMRELEKKMSSER